jgi:uncharacterized protein (TIGR02466 family)
MTTLIPLFPSTLYMDTIELDPIDLNNVEFVKNVGNLGSKDVNILEQEQFHKLRDSINKHLRTYFYKVLRANHQTEIYITESWLNKTVKGQTHHLHNHPNSIFSGVVFLECNPKGRGKLRFQPSKFNQIEYEVYEPNEWNGRGFFVNPEVGKIVIFPSDLLHMVDEYKSDTPRISLAFNTFVNNVVNKTRTARLTLNGT